MNERSVDEARWALRVLRRDLPQILAAAAVVVVLSWSCLDWPTALASTLLGLLMIVGASVDARCFILPDAVTLGGVAVALPTAALLAFDDPSAAIFEASIRAIGLSLLFEILRSCYARIRNREGLGFGDVKLAAAIGAWLPLELIPFCIALATGAALTWVVVLLWRRADVDATLRLPFGAFLCPALWLTFFAFALTA